MSLQEAAGEVLSNLSSFVVNDIVPLEIAQHLVRESAYWHGHKYGPARAPSHSERITSGEFGWELELGSNTFLVEEAIRRCVTTIADAAGLAAKSGEPAQERTLRSFLDLDVRESVAIRGRRFSGVYYSSDDYMHFGTQAIHVPSFISVIWDASRAHLIAGLGRDV